MAFQDFVSPNTATTLSTSPLGNAKNVRQLWHKGALLAEQTTDFFQEMESSSERGLIWSKTDLAKGNGSIMNFTTSSGFYKKPKLGDALFENAADFDKRRQGNFQLLVDFARLAVRDNIRTEEIMGMRGDIQDGTNVELGKTLGRFKSEQLFGMFQHKLPPANVVYANGKTNDTLKSGDIFRWDEVVTSGQAMITMGGQPANVAGRNANGPIWSQTYIAPTPACTSLKLDGAYRDVLKNGDTRGATNTIFAGGYPSIDGHTIVPYDPIDHDGVGPMGSFLNPKAFLGGVDLGSLNAIIAGTGPLTVQGGANSTDMLESEYFRYFEGSPYEYIDTGSFTAASATRYFVIYNTTGTNAGKWGMYAYTTGNTGTQIAITARLGANTVGTASTVIGGAGHVNGLGGTYTAVGASAAGVQFNAAINTDTHPIGSFIFPVNNLGVPIGDVIVMGRAAILRGYGMYRAEHTSDKLNGGFVTDRYLTSVFGQCFRQDRLNRVTSALRLRCAITYPGISMPPRS